MRKLWVVCLISLTIGTTHLACMPADAPQEEKLDPAVTEPVPYKNGVYYFPATDEDYRASLSSFLYRHPELDCRYFGADDGWVESGAGPRMRTTGHTVVCRDIAIDAQDEPVR